MKTADFSNEQSRKALAKMILKLFSLWGLNDEDQANLLGCSPESQTAIEACKNGEGLFDNRDVLDRAGWLLAIHKSLGILYPNNSEIRYSWVLRRNKVFDNLTPLDVMKEQGVIGLSKVSHYLEQCCNS
jgi:Protein of unknown function (DUF2384)